jgi:hypothetical protein
MRAHLSGSPRSVIPYLCSNPRLRDRLESMLHAACLPHLPRPAPFPAGVRRRPDPHREDPAGVRPVRRPSAGAARPPLYHARPEVPRSMSAATRPSPGSRPGRRRPAPCLASGRQRPCVALGQPSPSLALPRVGLVEGGRQGTSGGGRRRSPVGGRRSPVEDEGQRWKTEVAGGRTVGGRRSLFSFFNHVLPTLQFSPSSLFLLENNICKW